LLLDEGAGADVLQADGVQHAGGGLKQPRRRIAHHRFARESFRDKAPQLPQRDHIFELDAVSKSSAGGDDRVLESNTAEVDAQIRLARGNTFRGGGSHEISSVTACRKSWHHHSQARAILTNQRSCSTTLMSFHTSQCAFRSAAPWPR